MKLDLSESLNDWSLKFWVLFSNEIEQIHDTFNTDDDRLKRS